MVIPALVAAVLALHPAPWKHVVVTRSDGAVQATIAYDARPSGFGQQYVRHVTLLVRRGQTLVLARKLTRFAFTPPFGRLSVRLEDVWGDQPAVLVTMASCGNRCGYALYVALPRTGRLLFHNFGIEFPNGSAPGWVGGRVDGTFEFVTADSRFFCVFADCASSTMPVQVLAIDPSGTRFADVSRTRPDLLRSDARHEWRAYEQESRRKNLYEPLGALVPYCADEYRLGVTAYCDRMLPASVKRQLTAWGYR